MGDGREEQSDWLDKVVGVAGALGFNKVRVRWKLERLRQRMERARFAGQQRMETVRYAHKLCPHCGRLNDETARTCVGCGGRLPSRAWQLMQRIGLLTPQAISATALLITVILIAYGRVALAARSIGWPEFNGLVLFRFGAHYPPAVWAGEWWRLGTAVLLHANVWHIGFNLFALSQVGPAIEGLFGRARMLCFFLVTGIAGSLGSELMGLRGISIGASGAIMGLCGVAAGWGHRDGTSIGRNARNAMLRWALYTVLFGFFIGADNGAHISGFIAGALIGLVAKPDRSRAVPAGRTLWGLFGCLALLGLLLLVLFPPASPFLQGTGE